MSASDAAAALANTFPKCATTCFEESIAFLSNCTAADFGCICPNKALQAAAGQCFLENCNTREILTATRINNADCGIIPNDDSSFVPFLYATLVISTLLVSVRFWARIQKGVAIWWDDWAILAAMLVTMGWTVVCLQARPYGAGRDIWSATPDDIDNLMRLLFISFVFYTGARCLIRVSITLFMLRIFDVYESKRFIRAMLLLNIALSGTFLVVLLFQCRPVSYFWVGWDDLHEGKCIDQWAMLLTAGILAIVLDIVVTLLPLVWIVKLQFSLLKKIATGLMMSLGIIVIAVSIEKIIVLRRFLTDPDVTSGFPTVTIWGGLDIHVAIVCACLPSLRLVFRAFKTRFLSPKVPTGKGGLGNAPSGGSKDRGNALRTIGGGSYPDTGSPHIIKMATTVQQLNSPLSDSDTNLSPRHSLDLHSRQQGITRGEAWA